MFIWEYLWKFQIYTHAFNVKCLSWEKSVMKMSSFRHVLSCDSQQYRWQSYNMCIMILFVVNPSVWTVCKVKSKGNIRALHYWHVWVESSSEGNSPVTGGFPSQMAVTQKVLPCLDDIMLYNKTSNIRRTLVANKIVDHSDVVGASPVGAAPTTSSFSTYHLASTDSAKTATRQYKNILSVEIWCVLY